jgi:hypothetical protein
MIDEELESVATPTSAASAVERRVRTQCIIIDGENAIISASEFDYLRMVEYRSIKLGAVYDAAKAVIARDWSDNDPDCIALIGALAEAVYAI